MSLRTQAEEHLAQQDLRVGEVTRLILGRGVPQAPGKYSLEGEGEDRASWHLQPLELCREIVGWRQVLRLQ